MTSQRGQAPGEAADGSSAVSLLWGHSGAVYGLDYSPDQQLLYTSSADGTVRLWSTELAANLVAYRCSLSQMCWPCVRLNPAHACGCLSRTAGLLKRS